MPPVTKTEHYHNVAQYVITGDAMTAYDEDEVCVFSATGTGELVFVVQNKNGARVTLKPEQLRWVAELLSVIDE